MAVELTKERVEVDKNDVRSLLIAGMVDEAKALFSTRKDKVEAAMDQWNVAQHKVHERPKKYMDDSTEVPQAKLPLPYQKKIVQSAVAFLFGKPVKLIQLSEGTDKAFKLIDDLWTEMRMASKNRKNARTVFSQTASAKLFVEYKDPEAGEKEFNSVKCILLSKDQGNDLYYKKDQYGVMLSIARGYSSKAGDQTTEHFDAYFTDTVLKCRKVDGTWSVIPENNLSKKIPISYYEQDQTEWDDVQDLIERLEMLISKRADNNDYTADAILVLTGDVESLPGKDETGKVVKLTGENASAQYLSPQMAMDMVKDERTTLNDYILYFTDTPDLSSDQLKSIGQDSGKALEMKFFPALLKAMDKLEVFEEMTDREINILKAFVGNVIDVSPTMKKELKELKIGYQFGNPLPDNVKDMLEMLSTAVGGKPIMSQKTAVDLNPLVKDSDAENIQIKDEQMSTIVD
jgi:SPP1 family phage portal protein